jgi:hypothetical protein
MTDDPWTDPDPQPGDFDADLAALAPGDIERHEGDPSAHLTILIGVKSEDAERLTQLAAERGQGVDEVVAELLRSSERHAA